MNVRPTQKSTRLGTELTFEVLDMRGRKGFPKGQTGLVFVHKDTRVVPCRLTGQSIHLNATYVVRTDTARPREWRVDHQDFGPLFTAVYGPDHESYFLTNEDAAATLVNHLEQVKQRALCSDHWRAS